MLEELLIYPSMKERAMIYGLNHEYNASAFSGVPRRAWLLHDQMNPVIDKQNLET